MNPLPSLLLSLFLLLTTVHQDPERAATKVLAAGDAVTVQLAEDTFHGLLTAPLGQWVHLRADDGARMAFPRETVRWIREGR